MKTHPATGKKIRKKEFNSRVENVQAVNTPDPSTRKKMLLFILVITSIAFLPALWAKFVNWDDGDYAYNNIFIRSFNLKDIFTTPVQGNYHPLTMLTLAVNYQISGLNAWSYHLFNIVFHLVNCLLVFRFAYLLSNRNQIIAFVTALFFAIHPMHVESVAWIAERKDVLYGMFFLLGLIAYVRYVDNNSRKHYFLALIFLALSLLSKPAAVIFPLTLFCIDIFRRRKIDLKLILEKIPFFIPALVIGLVTYFTQKEIGAAKNLFPFDQQIFLGFYGIMMYVVKAIIPVNLSAFHPFPPVTGSLPGIYYFAPVVTVLLAFAVYKSWRSNRIVAFGLLFFIVNLLLVLQFLGVGSAIIAERYTYIPYVGLFFILGAFISRYAVTQKRALKFIVPLSLIFAILTFRQTMTWYDSGTLWANAVRSAPSYTGFLNLGHIRKQEKKMDEALQYYSEAIRLNGLLGDVAYVMRGNIYMESKNYDFAMHDYRKALSIKPLDVTTLHNMGVVFAHTRQYDSAFIYYAKAIQLDSTYKAAYNSRGVAFMEVERFEDAIRDFNKYLELEPGAARIYNIISTCYRFWLRQEEALDYVNKAIKMDPDPHYVLNRAHVYGAMGRYDLAKKDVLFAKSKGVPIDPAMESELGIQ